MQAQQQLVSRCVSDRSSKIALYERTPVLREEKILILSFNTFSDYGKSIFACLSQHGGEDA
jgi:hypothetical protein